ncbi:MAG: hypothetical protein JJU30_09485 [Alkalimonas sp.]|nr:hypothetical protein [Alkalimonas sp.]
MAGLLLGCSDRAEVGPVTSANEAGELDALHWRYATDPHGSSASYSGDLVQEGIARIAFHRVPRVDAQNNSWVELIYDLPDGSLQGASGLRLSYQSSRDLVVKLAQLEYGEQGDQSYAHYQAVLPAATEWQEATLSLADFQRPDWTPATAIDHGIVPAHVSAIYLVPDLTDEAGGQASLSIRAVDLIK